MIITVHVDDGMVLCNEKHMVNQLVDAMMTKLRKVSATQELRLYLGMDIERSDDGRIFSVSQERYILDKFDGYGSKQYRTPMADTTNLRTAEPNPNNDSLLPDTGTMRYLADRTRPDILVALGEVSTGASMHPSDLHVGVAERIKHYLVASSSKTLHLGGTSPLVMFAYCDAAYIATGNCKSRLGSCIFLNTDSGAISSTSRNDTTVSHSSTEAELKAIDMVCREVVYFRKLLEFLGHAQAEPTAIYVDNKSAIELCSYSRSTPR